MLDTITIDFHTFVDNFISAVEAKDNYTAGHSNRVAEIAFYIAEAMNLDHNECLHIHIAAHLHDIGKIGIPDGILLKTGKLSNAEFEVMKSHAEIGYNILKNNESLKDIASYVLSHHEKYNGTGYPHGISGVDIPLGARIITVADAFDAMVTKRTYKEKMPLKDVKNELILQSGKHFDPDVAKTFLDILDCPKKAEYIASIIESN